MSPHDLPRRAPAKIVASFVSVGPDGEGVPSVPRVCWARRVPPSGAVAIEGVPGEFRPLPGGGAVLRAEDVGGGIGGVVLLGMATGFEGDEAVLRRVSAGAPDPADAWRGAGNPSRA